MSLKEGTGIHIDLELDQLYKQRQEYSNVIQFLNKELKPIVDRLDDAYTGANVVDAEILKLERSRRLVVLNPKGTKVIRLKKPVSKDKAIADVVNNIDKSRREKLELAKLLGINEELIR